MKTAVAPTTFLLGDGLKIWTNPRGAPNIVVLCRGSLFVSNIDSNDLAEAVDRLSAGTSPDQVFGAHMREIPLIAVEQADADLRHNTFRFRYHSGIGMSRDEFRLAHTHDAEELLAILRHQLGDRYTDERIGFNLIRLCSLPFLVLMIHVLLCVVAWLMVNPLDGIKRRSNVVERWLQDVVGSSGLQLFGTTVATILVIWMLARILSRPAGFRFDKIKEAMT